MHPLNKTLLHHIFLKRTRAIKLESCIFVQKYNFKNKWNGLFTYNLLREKLPSDDFLIKIDTDIYLSNNVDSYQERLINKFIISGKHTKTIHTKDLNRVKSNLEHLLVVFTPYDKEGISLCFEEIPKEIISMLDDLKEDDITFNFCNFSKL